MSRFNLLVGGDSFAQFDPEDGTKLPYVHWCKRVAIHVGGDATSVSLPGHDISTTVYSAIRELIIRHDEYTHLIFFVTSFYRNSELNVSIGLDDFDNQLFLLDTEIRTKCIHDLYKDNSIKLYDIKPLPLNHCSVEDKIKYSKTLKQFYYHDKLALLIYLKVMCDYTNTRLLLVDMFNNPLLRDPIFYDMFSVYDIEEIEKKFNFHRFDPDMGSQPGHFLDINHLRIYEHFMENNTIWIQ